MAWLSWKRLARGIQQRSQSAQILCRLSWRASMRAKRSIAWSLSYQNRRSCVRHTINNEIIGLYERVVLSTPKFRLRRPPRTLALVHSERSGAQSRATPYQPPSAPPLLACAISVRVDLGKNCNIVGNVNSFESRATRKRPTLYRRSRHRDACSYSTTIATRFSMRRRKTRHGMQRRHFSEESGRSRQGAATYHIVSPNFWRTDPVPIMVEIGRFPARSVSQKV